MSRSSPRLPHDVRDHLKSMVGVTCDVVLKAPGEVPRSQGKAVRVKDSAAGEQAMITKSN